MLTAQGRVKGGSEETMKSKMYMQEEQIRRDLKRCQVENKIDRLGIGRAKDGDVELRWSS